MCLIPRLKKNKGKIVTIPVIIKNIVVKEMYESGELSELFKSKGIEFKSS